MIGFYIYESASGWSPEE